MSSNAKFEVEIYGNTAKFENSLKGINSAMTSLRGEASQLRKDLKLDPTNTAKMAQLQRNYTQQLEQTKNKASQLKTELAGIDKSTPDGQKKFIQLSKSLQDSELKANYLEKDIKQLDNSISNGKYEVNLKTDKAEGQVSKVKTSFSALREVATGALRQIGSSITNALGNKMGDWISDTMATQKAMNSLKNTMNFAGVGSEFDSLSKRMGQVAVDTNANTEDTLKLASTFVGLGDNAQTAGDKVENIVKANQAFGGSGEDLKGVVQAYGQMSASGKVTAENINQLTDNNTALGASLKKTVMDMNPQLKQYGSFAEASSKGAVSVEMLDKALAQLGKAGGGGVETIGDAFASLDETIALALLPTLDEITPLVTDIVNGIADALPDILSKLTDLAKFLKENWDWLSKVAIAVGAVAIAFGIFNAVMGIASTVMTVFGVSMGVAFGWIGIIIAAIAGLIAVGVLIWQNWQTIADFAVSIWGGIKEFFAGLGVWFGELWQGITEVAMNVWNGVGEFIMAIWEGIKVYFSTLVAFYSALFSAVGSVISTAWNAIVQFAQTAFNNIVAFFTPLGNVFKALFDLVVAVFRLGWEIIKALARGAWMGIQAIWFGRILYTNLECSFKHRKNSIYSNW